MLLLCLLWLLALVVLGSGVWGLAPGFVTRSAVEGLALRLGDCCGTQERASHSQELKPWGFLSTKLLSCTSLDTQEPAPRLPQPVSYSVSRGLHPPSSCADPALSLIPKHWGANQHVQNPVTLGQCPVCWTWGRPAGPHSDIPGEPMNVVRGGHGMPIPGSA